MVSDFLGFLFCFEKELWEVFSFILVCFLGFVSFVLGFSWQHVHCWQWTQNHQHWANLLHGRTFPAGAVCHYLSLVQKKGNHYLCGWGNKNNSRMIVLDLCFMVVLFCSFSFFFFFFLLENCVNNMFLPNYLVLLND